MRSEAPLPKHPVDAFALQAARQVTEWSRQEGLHPDTDDDPERPHYTVQQGLRAAHFAREDAATNLVLLGATLRGQRRILRLLWVTVALLALILWRVW